ncbi:hypothetical protein DFH07DRAFT_44143 [Mycena maculata]|uniref:Uncharacterized protein n=1 Tax=Mycena maculata TaxID=230809 RepID=A0AAD7II23_9AGAR|nr:hypothetical protein DFH07DRAFT_44143 [Mycena maculata]
MGLSSYIQRQSRVASARKGGDSVALPFSSAIEGPCTTPDGIATKHMLKSSLRVKRRRDVTDLHLSALFAGGQGSEDADAEWRVTLYAETLEFPRPPPTSPSHSNLYSQRSESDFGSGSSEGSTDADSSVPTTPAQSPTAETYAVAARNDIRCTRIRPLIIKKRAIPTSPPGPCHPSSPSSHAAAPSLFTVDAPDADWSLTLDSDKKETLHFPRPPSAVPSSSPLRSTLHSRAPATASKSTGSRSSTLDTRSSPLLTRVPSHTRALAASEQGLCVIRPLRIVKRAVSPSASQPHSPSSSVQFRRERPVEKCTALQDDEFAMLPPPLPLLSSSPLFPFSTPPRPTRTVKREPELDPSSTRAPYFTLRRSPPRQPNPFHGAPAPRIPARPPHICSSTPSTSSSNPAPTRPPTPSPSGSRRASIRASSTSSPHLRPRITIQSSSRPISVPLSTPTRPPLPTSALSGDHVLGAGYPEGYDEGGSDGDYDEPLSPLVAPALALESPISESPQGAEDEEKEKSSVPSLGRAVYGRAGWEADYDEEPPLSPLVAPALSLDSSEASPISDFGEDGEQQEGKGERSYPPPAPSLGGQRARWATEDDEAPLSPLVAPALSLDSGESPISEYAGEHKDRQPQVGTETLLPLPSSPPLSGPAYDGSFHDQQHGAEKTPPALRSRWSSSTLSSVRSTHARGSPKTLAFARRYFRRASRSNPR